MTSKINNTLALGFTYDTEMNFVKHESSIVTVTTEVIVGVFQEPTTFDK